MTALEFRVLGPVRMLRDQEPVALGGSTALALLSGLLLSANSAVPADRLTEIVWGDRQPARPHAALHNAISRLRRLLGNDMLVRLPSGYQLRVDDGQLDLLRSDRLVAAADEATQRGAYDQAATVLDEAIELWREPLLGNVNSPALHDEAVRLTEKYLSMREEWADLCLRLGRHAAVARALAPLVRAHPFRERLVGQLMLAMFNGGRQAEALAAYESLRSALSEELGVDPGRQLQDLHVRIVRSDVGAEGFASRGHGAPAVRIADSGRSQWRGPGAAPEGLVGRGDDIRALAAAVQDCRVVTLVGAAGAGKTAVALATAARLTVGFPDGVAVVQLGTLPWRRPSTDPATDMTGSGVADVVGAVRLALELPAVPAQRAEGALTAGLRDREMLLVLDNAEHVSAACGWTADLIVRSCPRIRVLCTSRRPLGLSGEAVVELGPLGPAAAAELLTARVARHHPSPDLSADPAGVTELCRLTGGLPLAVELAAARLRTMSLRTLLDRIGLQPGLLAAADRPGLPHQRGLDATLGWSYDLLTEPGRLLLCRLAVFVDSFTLESAERVCGYAPLACQDVAGLLSSLVDDSLVQAARDHDGYTYRLLAPVREFALARAAPADHAAARGRHLRYLYEMNGPCGNGPVTVLEHGFSDQLAFSDLPTVQGWPAFADLLAAWDWTLGGKAEPADAELGARLLMRTRPAWEGRSGAASCVLDHLMRALELPGVLPASLFAHLTLLAGNLHYRLGYPAEARRLIERALDRLPDGSRARVAARSDLALIASGQAAPDAARIIRGSAEAARGTGDRQMIAVSLAKAAHMMASLGRVPEALNLIDEAGAAIGDDRALRRHYLARRSFVLLRAGLVAQAHDDARQVLADLGKATSYERVLTLLVHGWAQAYGDDPGAAHRTLNEGLSLARHRQVLVLAPDLTLALGYARRGTGQFGEAVRLTGDALRLSLSQHDLLTGIGALHLAMALAHDTANADAARIAVAVRECRLRSGVSAWPLTECGCARYEKALGVDSVPAPSGALEPSLFTATAELVLTHLSARPAAPAC